MLSVPKFEIIRPDFHHRVHIKPAFAAKLQDVRPVQKLLPTLGMKMSKMVIRVMWVLMNPAFYVSLHCHLPTDKSAMQS